MKTVRLASNNKGHEVYCRISLQPEMTRLIFPCSGKNYDSTTARGKEEVPVWENISQMLRAYNVYSNGNPFYVI